MWLFLAVLVIVLGFCYLGALAIFFSDEIIEWLEAKADCYRAMAASLRQETTHEDGISHKEGSQ